MKKDFYLGEVEDNSGEVVGGCIDKNEAIYKIIGEMIVDGRYTGSTEFISEGYDLLYNLFCDGYCFGFEDGSKTKCKCSE